VRGNSPQGIWAKKKRLMRARGLIHLKEFRGVVVHSWAQRAIPLFSDAGMG
jgi:hypothetical protein